MEGNLGKGERVVVTRGKEIVVAARRPQQGAAAFLDSVGIPEAVARLEALAKQYGPRFEPAPILREMAKKGKKFYP